MSANKHKSRVGGRKQPMTEEERVERFAWRLSRDVSNACDNYQLRVNGYKSTGFRGLINAEVMEHESIEDHI